VILLRNLDPNNWLCNETRLIFRALQNNAIDAEIVGVQDARKRVFIPRPPLSPSDDISLLFKFKRKQFRVRLSFAMTINKSQGQTIPNVGTYLPKSVFSHGQLYVGLSRGYQYQQQEFWLNQKKNRILQGRAPRILFIKTPWTGDNGGYTQTIFITPHVNIYCWTGAWYFYFWACW